MGRPRGKANPQTQNRPHWVYRCWDADDVLLYVGCSVNPEARWCHWRQNRMVEWPSWVARRELRRFPDGPSAWEAETAAIENEKPLFNVERNRAHDNSRRGVRDMLDDPTRLTAELASGLAAARNATGIGQAALAERVGVSQSYISRAERGHKLFWPEQIQRIAEACECETDEVYRLVELARALTRYREDPA